MIKGNEEWEERSTIKRPVPYPKIWSQCEVWKCLHQMKYGSPCLERKLNKPNKSNCPPSFQALKPSLSYSLHEDTHQNKQETTQRNLLE